MKISRDRFALGSYNYFRYPFDYFLDTAVMLGIKNLELWGASPHLCFDIIDEKSIKKIKTQIIERNLSVIGITPEQCNYPVNLAAEEEDLRKYSINIFCRAIDVAVELNSPTLLVTSGCGYFNRPVEEAWERSSDSLRILSKYAHNKGIKLVLETLTPLSSNIINNPKQQMKMISEMPEDSMTAMLDIGQMVYMNQSIVDYQKILGKELSHVHIHDSNPGIHVALGDGNLPIKEYLDILEKGNYKGLYSFECNDMRYRKDPREADIKNIEYLLRNNII
jgi:protein FrlC